MKKLSICSLLVATAGMAFAQDLLVTEPIQITAGHGNHHPQIEVTGDNKLAITWTDPSDQCAWFMKQGPDGSFLPAIKLNPPGLSVASYNWSGPDLFVEESAIYAVFQATNMQSYLVKSTDNGASFGDTVRVASAGANFPFYPDVAVYQDTVYVTFMNHADATGALPQYVVSRSVDGGESFEPFVAASSLISSETWIPGLALELVLVNTIA